MSRPCNSLLSEPVFRMLEDMDCLVDVHWNFQKRLFSVTAVSIPDGVLQHSKGRVIANVDSVVLASPEFRVSEAGRQRVLRNRRKNVHAKIRGRLIGFDESRCNRLKKASYNPYTDSGFMVEGTPDRTLLLAQIAFFSVESGRAVVKVRRPIFAQ